MTSANESADAGSAVSNGSDLPSYAELHCLSNFTFLRGASHPEELVTRACKLGYSGLALTDECSVAGVVRALLQLRREVAQGRQLKLIVGAEFRLTCGLRFVALAPHRQAYGRLCRLITRGRRASEKGTYTLERLDVQALLSHCLILWLPGKTPQPDEARWLAERFPGDVWIAAELHRDGEDRERLSRLQRLGRDLGLPLVASGDVHMHERRRRRLQDVLTAIRLTVPIAEAGWHLYPNGERHLRERQRLARLYPPELLAETQTVASRCSFSLEELKYEYPHELVPSGETPQSYLRQLVEKGARWRWPKGVEPRTRESIENELAIIAELRYEPYFLTVHDIVRWAREKHILCQGRGSAANSVVCFCLGVTEVDPQRSAACMLVERFISRERNEPPDIDIDFEHDRREEVIQYVYRKYGRERAALASTVIMYRPRSALRDLGKAFGLDPLQVARLAKTMQWWDGSQIEEQRVREAGIDPRSPVLQQLLGLANELVGFPRHLSQHVGGFVISQGRLDELVPIENATMDDRTVVQWDKDDINDLGLLKVDLLGLGMLTALRRTFDLVNDYWAPTGKYHKRFTLGALPPEDPRVYRMISKADTIGVFQIESRAQMSMLPRLKPEKFYDLVIEVAIVRPGPIQGDMVHPYLRRRCGQEPVTYPSPQVRDVLERTLGVPIFQEQVMQLAMVAAGFTGGEADALRRAMAAWKKRGGLEPFRDKLINGMLTRGYTQNFAERIFKQMLGFGEYGFPECVVGETRVVDADTDSWRTIDEIVASPARLENTLACDENFCLQKRRVLAVVPSGVKPVWRLTTAAGHSVIATAEHPFMIPGSWRKLGELRVGDSIAAARSLPVEQLVDSEILWDPIVSIEALGQRPTYDLSIEGHHNFLANHLVVHNSHACSFALLVYDSAWLKCFEPAAFTCGLLNSLPMGFYAPAQLVRDAREHGVEVRPVRVEASDYESTLERRKEDGRPALRLGMRLVKALSEAGAQRLVQARATRPFTSVQDLADRAALDRSDLEALAAAGALASLSGNRHLAFWEVAGSERPLPLAPRSSRAAHDEEGTPLLTAPTSWQTVVADYSSTGLTLGAHPLKLLRHGLARERVLCAKDLQSTDNGAHVRVAGIVLMRQHPASANGVTFMTIEDETGPVNIIVWEQVSREQRRPFLESRLLEVRGELQRQHGVTHVIAKRLIDRSPMIGELLARSRDFH